MYKLLTVGADPEIFFTRQGIPQSVEGLIGGTKREPKAIPGYPGYALQEDNVAAEFNIPPCKTPKEFAKAIDFGVRAVRKIARKNKCDLAFVSALEFPHEQLKTAHAGNLGCEPDFNAYSGDKNPSPDSHTLLRTAAGHVHVGYAVEDLGRHKEAEDRTIVKVLDLILGVPSILETEPNDRRQMYGKAGAYRPKSYGVEYRTLDNFWLTSKAQQEHIFNMVGVAIAKLHKDGWLFVELLETWESEIRKCINTHDRELALELVNTLEVPLFPNGE